MSASVERRYEMSEKELERLLTEEPDEAKVAKALDEYLKSIGIQ